MTIRTRILIPICATLLFFIFGCSESESGEESNQQSVEVNPQFDTTFYQFESLVINGSTISFEDTSYDFFTHNYIFNVSEEYVFGMYFSRDSIFINQGNITSAMWFRFRDSIEVGYTSEKLRQPNQWTRQKDGRIFIATRNHHSKADLEIQYAANMNKNYVVVKQLFVPIERANKIKRMSLKNGADFKEAQSKDSDFDEKLWN